MKQTILSKCFSKMKRVALTLFAALCVGSVWAEEGDTTTPEVTPEPEPTSSTSALTIDPSAGYIVTGLGELGDQAAVVFTNPDAVATWKTPKDLKNVEILAVGGGGGGGGHFFNGSTDATKSGNQGGAGGGGGAVVTGFIKNLSSESTVSVTVGAGGAGGSAATADTLGVEKAENGGNTIISVDGLAYITAYGGGGDGGKDSSGVAIGGSNSGVRQNQTAVALNELAVVGTGAEDLLENVTVYRNKGGAGYSTSSGYPGAGGGGAMEAGGTSTGSGVGGSGGAGVALDITGSSVVYGSGGGGGLGKSVSGGALVGKAGVGAGAGYADEKGGDALANQGGGGGGGSYKKNGGAGGSGIVVLRFAYFENEITVDVENNIQSKIASKPYTGAELTSGLVDTYAYQVKELAEDLVSPGKKTVRVTLNDGYVWSDGDKNRSKDFDWYIASVETFADGYKVIGLGRNGDEVALVFTKSSSWTVPANINNAQFLVVGGGGGGGADTYTKDAYSGGGGGGGGGVVAGVVSFAKGTTVTVTVGAGGAGGTGATTYSSQYGAAASGANSSFSTPAGQQVVANGGGGSGGLTRAATRSTVQSGAAGGSSAGARAKTSTTSGGIGNATKGTAVGVVSYVAMGNKGGSSYGSYAGGGGGGAMTAGSSASADNTPGAGGQGYESYITGERVVYGSGGGGAKITGTGAKGGEGAGDGNPTAQSNGMSALPNQGGGGGGAGRTDKGTKYKGGNGGSGIVVIRYSVKTAEVDSVAYDTLAEAFAAAGDGATVKLLNDAELAEKVTIKTALTLDLNGCTLSETVTDSYGAIYIGMAGNLTITDSATGGKIATDGGIVIGNYGTVTVAGGTIEAGAAAEDDTSIYNFYYNGSTYGKLTVNGGKVGRIWNCGNANITAGTVGDIDNSGAMTIAEEAVIEDEEIILGNDAADVPNAGTIITSKTLNVSTLADDYVVEIVDGVYKLKYTKTYTVTLPAAPANTIWYCNGQEVTGPVYAEYGSNVTITLKPAEGCSFSDGAAELTVIEISAIGADTEVTLDNVTVPEAFQVVAKIGDTPYASLQAAYAAAEAESTIVLCKDVTGAGLVIDKSVTIDFGGNTYTFNDGVGNVPSNGFQILNGNTVTLKNGELNVDAGSADKFYTLIQNYANLTVEDMVLDGTNLDKWSKTDGDSYVLSNNSGTVVVAGATSIIANDEGALAYAFDVCKYKTYAIPTVTLNTTGTIAGKVEVSGGDFVYEAGTIEDAIVFTSGSVKGEVEDTLTIPEDKKLVLNEAGAYVLADKIVVAKVGDNLFETIAEAFAAAQAGDTVILEKSLAVNEVLQIPANVTLDLNGNELQALAVVGKLSMNGGALKTWDANTQTYFFMAAPAGALYQTSDAVMTIGADYSLSLDGGSVTLPNSWRTLLGQTLTIKSGAAFVIPTGVQLNLRGNAVVEDGATLTCDGTIALGNTYDAIDTSATLKSAQLAEGKVVSAVEGYRPVYANGVYSLEEIPAEFVAQVGAEKYATLQAALDVEANLAATITLIANTKEKITIPAGFTGMIDLNGFTLTGRIDSNATEAKLKNGSVIHTTGSKAAIQIEAGSLELTDINMESNYHGVRLNGAGTTATINSGTYRITSSAGTYNLIYASKANAKFYVYGGEFYNNGDTGSTWVLKSYASGSEINVYGGTFSAYSANTFEVANGGVIKVFGGTFTGCNPSATTHATVQPGYAVEGNGPWTVVASWTAPMPDIDDGDTFNIEYTDAVIAALQGAEGVVGVKVNNVVLKGDEAVKALNDAVACFEDAITIDGTTASLDIDIKVTEVNNENPAASTVVVTRNGVPLTVKATPTVKYFYPETKTWGSDKPESGAVLFKLVFEASSAN